jgi:hypothetical protein
MYPDEELALDASVVFYYQFQNDEPEMRLQLCLGWNGYPEIDPYNMI